MAIEGIDTGGQIGSEIDFEIVGGVVVVHRRADGDVNLVPALRLVVFLVGGCHLDKRPSGEMKVFEILHADKKGIVAAVVSIQ